MKAKTKKRIKHLLTKKKLVSKRTSRHFFRAVAVIIATISTGSLAYAITVAKPVVTVSVQSSGPDGKLLAKPATPTPKPAAVAVANGNAYEGRGSWYALGLPEPDALTCASRTFPRGTFLEVTDLYNGNTVVCRVNDYGPEAWTGRIIDLSRGSFRVVDNLGRGTIPVRLRVVSGPMGFNIPLNADFSRIIGYSWCSTKFSAQFCEANRK